MKKSLLKSLSLFLFLVLAMSIMGFAQNPISRIQSATGNTGANASTSISVTLGSPPVNGNTLIAVISTRGTTTGRVTSITQTGATWTRATQAANSNGTTTEIWYASNVSSAGTAVTITQSSLRSAAVVLEYSNIVSASALDVVANSTGNSTAGSTGTTTNTTLANELFIGGVGMVSSGYTLETITNSFSSVANTASTNSTATLNANVYALEKIVTATQTASTGGTISTSSQWSGAIATFKASNTVGAASSTPTLCINTVLTAITHTTRGATGIGTATGLPAGVSAAWASNTITISGTPTAAGTFNYSIPLTGGAGSVSASGTITVLQGVIDWANLQWPASQTICLGNNATIYGRIYESGVTEAAGSNAIIAAQIGYNSTNNNPSTWAAGNWAAASYNVQSGNNDEYAASLGASLTAGTYYYAFRYSLNGCAWQYGGYNAGGGGFWNGTTNVNGVLTISPNNTVGGASSTPTLCINTALTNITHTTTGATAIGTPTGLPAGVSASFGSNTITISGTPTASGTFNYTIPLSGGCSSVNATGTITVTPANTISLTSAVGTNAQLNCINTTITNITYSTTGATGATFSGLPAGVTGNWAANVVTISGTPTAYGVSNYTVTLTGGCGTVTANGTLNVNGLDYGNLQFPGSQTICQGNSFSVYGQVYEPGITEAAGANVNIVAQIGYNTSNTNPSTWPAGNWTNASYNAQSGNNDEYIANFGASLAAGTYYYTFRYSINGCSYQYGGAFSGFWNGTSNVNGVLTVTPNNTVGSASYTPTVCINNFMISISHLTDGATGIGTPANLPAGVSANWGTVLGVSGILISGTPTASGTFNYSIPLTGGCGSVNATGTILVNPSPVIANKTATICSGQSFTVTPVNGTDIVPAGTTYTWTVAANANVTGESNQTSAQTSISQTLTNTSSSTQNVVYTVTPTAPTGSCAGASFTVTVTVSPASVGGTIAGSAAVCSGTNSTTLTLSGHTGSITRWESSTSSTFASAVTSIANTTTTLTASNLTTTTYYRAVVTSGGCTAANSATATITVTQPGSGNFAYAAYGFCNSTATAQSISSSNFTGVSGTFSAAAGLSINATTGSIIPSTSTPSATPYTVTYTIPASGGCSVYTTTTNITIDGQGTGTIAYSPSTLCAGSAGTVSPVITGAGGSGSSTWFTSTAGLNMDANGVITPITSTPGTYTITYNRSGSGLCPAYTSTASVTVSSASVGGTIAGSATVCTGTNSTVLTLSGHTGTITRWESSTSSTFASAVTSIANTTTTFTASNLTTTTYYRAVITNGACVSNSATATVTVSTASVGGTIAGGATVCTGTNSTTLTLSGHTGAITRWESSLDNFATAGTSVANTTTTLTATNLSATTSYRAVLTSGACAAANSASATVTVSPASVGGTIAGSATVCTGTNSTVLTLSGHTGAITRWESSLNNFATAGTTIANTTTTLTATNLSATTSYRAVLTSGACAAANSATATVTVSSASVGGTIAGSATVCTGTNSTALTLSGHTGTITRWESSTSSTFASAVTSIANTTTTLTASNLTTTTYYRAVITNGSCAAANSATATVTVSTASVGGTIAGSATVCTGTNSTTLTLSGHTGAITRWESSLDNFATAGTSVANTTTTLTATNLSATTSYRAVVTSGACAAANSASATVTVSPASVGGTIAGSATVCTGTNSTVLTLSGHTGAITRWESSTSSTFASSVTSIANTTTTLTATNLTVTTYYRAVITSGNCAAANSATGSIMINALPTVTSATGNSKIYTGIANVTTVSAVAASGSTIDWYDASTGGTLIASGTLTYAPTAINVGTYTFFAQARNTTTGCTSAARTSATLTITTKALTITGITANDKVYDGFTTATISGTEDFVGLVNGETFTVTGTPVASFATAGVGSNKTVTVSGYNAPSSNYTVSNTILTASITAATLTITADNVNKAQGTALTTPVTGSTAFLASGLVNNETIGSVTITYGAAAASGTAAGIYANQVTASNATGGTFTAANYSITYVAGTILVGNIRYAVANGNWNATSTWAATSAGTPGASVPVAGDIAVIEKTWTVTVTANAACGTLQVGSPGNGQSGTITMSSNISLNVSGNVTLGGYGNTNRTGTINFASGSSISANNLIVGGTAGTPAAGIIRMTNGGTLTVNGDISVNTVSGNTWTPGTGTLVLANTTTLPSSIFTAFNNLTMNSGATVTSGVSFSVGGTMTVNGSFVPGATTHVISGAGTLTGTGSIDVNLISATALTSQYSITTRTLNNLTVDYSAAGNQSIFAATYGALNTSGSGTKTFLGNNTINNNITIGSGTTLNGGSFTSSLKGNWENNGTFTASTSIIQMDGTSAQNIVGTSATTFNSLTINNSSGVNLSGSVDATVNGTLTLTSGLVTPNANVFTLGSAGTISGASSSSYINGAFNRVITGTSASSFPIGKGGNFRPLTFTYASAPGTKTVRIEQFESGSPLSISTASTILFGGRYWEIDQSATGISYSIALNNGGNTPTGTAVILRREGTGATTQNATTFSTPNYSNTVAFTTTNASNDVMLAEAAIPLTITANNQTKCAGTAFTFAGTEFSQSGLKSDDQITGVTFTSAGSGAGASNGSYSIVPSSATGTGISKYTISYVNGSFTVNSALPASVSIVSNAAANTICSGTSVTFTATPTNGGSAPSYQWKVDGSNVGTNSATYVTSALTNGQTVTCVMTSNASPCLTASPATSVGITMTVSPASVGGAIAGGATVCTGTNSTILTLSGHTGSITRWESSTSSTFASAVTSIANTTTTLTATNLTATTYYRAVITSGSCTAANSATATVTVTPANTAAAASSTPTLCINTALTAITHATTGATGIGTATGLPAGVTAAWAANVITISGTPTAAGTFAYTIPLNGGCGTVNATGTITVASNPSASISYAGSPYCTTSGNATVTFTGTTGGTFSSTAGLNMNSSTGTINLGGSTPGTYTVTYTVVSAGVCSFSTTTSITITQAMVAGSINYGTRNHCTSEGTISVTGTGNVGGVYSSSAGLSINATTGDINCATSTPNAYVVYYTFAANGGCPQSQASAPVSITAAANASISYTGSPYCSSLGTAQSVNRTGTSGGTYSALPAGLTISASTGAITPNTSMPGTYTVTYDIAATGGCAAFSTTTSVTITALPTASISYAATPFCSTVATAQAVTQTGTTGGTYSASPAGLTINASTGAVTPSSSTAGSYTVTYTIAAANGCGAVTATTGVAITALPTASISYAGTPFCSTVATAQAVTRTGTTGGTYSASPAGLTINTSTGAVTPSSSTAGSYTVTYTIAAASGCGVVTATTGVTITTLPIATFSYTGTPYCNNASNPSPTFSGGGVAGTFSSTAGLVFVSTTTGQINLSASTPGTYTVTNTIAAADGCGVVTANSNVTITANPSATISYTGSPFCSNGGTASVTRSGTSGGSYSSTTGLSINATTGAVSLAASTPGTYTITYTIAASGGCSSFNTSRGITINTDGLWTGALGSDWNNPGNWQCGSLPTSTTTVIIGTGLPDYPLVDSLTPEIRSINIRSGGDLEIKGTSLKINGTITTSGGKIDATDGGLELTGTTAQTIPANIFVDNTVKNLTISNAAGVTLAGTTKVSKALLFGNVNNSVLNTGGNLILGSKYTLDGYLGDITNGGVNVGNTINGSVTIEKYNIAQRAFRFLTAPVVSAAGIRANWMEGSNNTSPGINVNPNPGFGTHISGTGGAANGFDQTNTNSPSMFTYDNITQTWAPVTNINTQFNPGVPYRIMVRGDRGIDLTINNPWPTATVLRAKGTLMTGNVTMTKPGGGATANTPALSPTIGNFSFVGNPYASAIDWSALDKTDLSSTIYIFDPTLMGANGRGAYVSYNDVLGTNNSPSSQIDNNIQSGQAFYVETTGPNPSVTFRETHKATIHRNVFRNTNTLPQMKLQLLLPGQELTNKSTDGLGVYFSDNFSDSIGNEDSYKFYNQDENISIDKGAKFLSLEGRKPVVQNDTIHLKMWQVNQPNYNLKIKLANFDPTMQAYLLDNYLNANTLLQNDTSTLVPFAITADPASKATDRFKVVFKPSSTLPIQMTNIKAYEKDKSVQVEWKVQNEKNMVRYEVEKSLTGSSFEKVGVVNAKANPTFETLYNWLDENAVIGDNFYRIKAFDLTGTSRYSQVVKVRLSNIENTISVNPNPIIENVVNIKLKNMEAGLYSVQMVDNIGKIVYSGKINHRGGSHTHTITLTNKLANGVYQLQLLGNEKNYSISVFVE